MSILDLTQHEADALFSIEKHCIDDTQYTFPGLGGAPEAGTGLFRGALLTERRIVKWDIRFICHRNQSYRLVFLMSRYQKL
jgi:hypothetical protein